MPEKILNQDQLKQLDSNIRKMIGDGLGKEDIDMYAKDFKEKFGKIAGPSPAAGPVMPSGLPTFQEQMPMMQANRFTEAVRQDKKKSGSYIGAIHDSFVSAIDPIMYAGDELFIDSYEFLSGKKLDAATKKGIRTTAETIRQVAPFAGPKKTQDKEYVQEVQGGWDMRDGFGVKDMKALGLMGSRVAGDLAIAAAAQSVGVPMGSTYFIQGAGSGYQEYNEMVDKGIVPEDKTAKNAYALTTGVINGLLEKYAFDKIFGSGPAFNAVKKKVTAEVLKQVSKATTKVTVDTIEKTGAQLLKKELSGLGRKAQRAGFAAGVEAITEGSQTALEEGAKVLTNAIQGGQIFDEEDIKKNIGWNVFNAAVAGGLMGGPMGIANTMMTNVDNTLVKEIANAKNETELDKIIQELEQSMKDSNASEEEIDAMRQSAVKYNDISKTIPQSATPEARANIIGLIDRRNGIDEKMTNWQAELEQIDESMRPDVEAEMNTLVDAKDMINDEIRENAAGGKFKYFEDKGKFFKQFENTDPVEITKSRFELQNIKDNATTKSQEQVQESGPSSDISQPEGTQVVEDQAPNEPDAGYRYIVSEEGDEVPITALINKKVRINGEPAILYKEGRRIVARVLGTNRILDTFGTEAEMMNALPEQFGIEVDDTVVSETPSGGYRVEGQDLRNQNENPMDAISYDQNGKVMNVVLTTAAGKRRKFRGAVAQDLAYQITLKEALKNEDDFEAFLEQEYEQELENARLQAAAQEQAAPAAEPVPEPAQAEQPTVEPAAPSTTVPTYGRITVDRDDSRPVKGRLAKKLVADAKRVLNSIKNFGDFSVNIHDQNSFEQAILEATGSIEFAASRGFYITSNGEIHVNIDNAAPDTVLHEGFHPILDFMARNNPQVVDDLFNELSAIPEAAGIIEMVNEQYDGEMTQKKEAITNFVAGVANGDIIVNPSNFAKIRRFIANLLKKLGLPIEPKVLLDVNNPTKLVELSKFISEVFETGTEIYQSDITRAAVAKDLRFEGGDLVTKGEYLDYQGNPIPPEKMQFSLGNDYSDTKTKTTFAYLKNRQEFEKLKQDGFITENMVLDDFVGSKFVLHAPDNAFTGTISKNGEVIIEGKGGVFYPIRFHKDGYFWASTSTAAKSMASMLNEMIEDNGGKIYMALVSSPSGKLFSSTTAANGVMEFFASSAMDRAIGLNQSTVIEAITAAAASSSKKKVKKKEKDGTETVNTVEFGLRVNVPKTKVVDGKRKPMTIADVKSFIAKKLNPETSTFDDRKLFSTELIREISDRIKGTRTEQILGRFFDTGILNKSYKQQGNIQKGYKLSATNISQSLSEMLSEPMLKGSKTQDVYAVLEIEGEVEAVKSDKHESYPMAIRSKSGSRTKVHVLQEREQWSDRFADPETGNKVEKDRRFNIFPTSGVSVQPLTLLPKSEIAFQRMAPNGKPSNLTAKQYQQVRTPEFKKWFGDWENDPENASKLLDDNGEPLVVYHGTKNKFDEFDPTKMSWEARLSQQGPGFYFTNNKKAASGYGKPINTYVSIKNPLEIKESSQNITKEQALELFNNGDYDWFYTNYLPFITKQTGTREQLLDKYISDNLGRGFDKFVLKNIKRAYTQEAGYTKLLNNMQDVLGVDGIIERPTKTDAVYVALSPNQIKSATENVGTFSTEDNRIQFQRMAPNGKPSNLTEKQYQQVRTPEFKKWFGDWENDPANASKVVDENGEPLVVYHGTSKDKDFNKFNVPDRGAWFTSSSKEASQYAVENDSMKSSYDFFTKVRTDINASPRVVPVFLNIKKLYDFNTFFSDDEKRKLFYAKSYRSVQKELFRKALVDAYQSSQVNVSGIDMGKGVYVVLGESSQIKSATANVGTFSTEDARIQMQKATPTKETRKGVTVKGKEIVSPKLKARAQNLFTSSGVLGQAIRTFKEQMGGELTAEMKIAERSTNEVLKLMEKYKGVISTQDIDNYLTGNATTKQFPLDLATKLTEMRVHIDGLTGRLIDLGVITAEESKALYENNKGRYMLRSYELFNRKDKGVVTIDNVTKRLKNVDQAKVDAALRFLEAEIAADGKPRTPQELKDEAISRANEYLADNDMSFGGRGVDGSVNTTSLSKRSEYLDKSPEIRALMGEYTDPVYRYYSSIFKLANLTSHRAYLNNLKAEGMGKFLFDKATGEATTPIAAEGSKSLAPLNGLYTFPEIKEALQQADRENKLLVEYVAGHIRMMKTVYNPATHVKNVLGSLAFSISNGHWLYAGKAFSYIKKANRAKLIELLDILNREGVLNNNIGAGEINQYFDKFADVNSVLQNINNNANKSALAAAGGKAKANLAKIPNALKKAYAIEDDIFKVLGFVNEANMYAKAEYGVEYDALNDTQRAAINKIATEHVKSFYPTFSRVPKFVKTFSKGLLLGNFLSFPVESVRVSYNTISQGVKEMRSSNPKIKAIGLNRLVGSLLYNGMISSLTIFAAMASGDDDDKKKSENQGYGGLLGYLNDTEEQKQNRRNSRLYRAPWNKDSQVITTKFSEGKLIYVDIGSIDSYGYQREVWSTFWDNLSDKNGFNKAMAATLGRTVSPFIDIDMTVAMFKNLLDNKDESGNLIANLELPFEKRLPDYGKFVLRKVAPGVVNSAVKGINYYQSGEMDKLSAEAISQLVRTYNVDIKKSFQNYIYASPYEENTERTGFKKRLDNAEMIYTRIKNSKYISQEEKEEQYKMAVDAYKKVLMDTNKYYVAAVASGVDASELTRILMNAKLGDKRGQAEVLSIVQNRYDFPDEVYIRR